MNMNGKSNTEKKIKNKQPNKQNCMKKPKNSRAVMQKANIWSDPCQDQQRTVQEHCIKHLEY